ncbi:MAG: DUF4097 family beta strand repeat-containing protein [Gemmatimonadales bacterium]
MVAITPSRFVFAALLCLPTTAAAQSSRHVLQGERIAVYNLVGELRVGPADGSDVVVEVVRGGPDAARLEIATGPLRDEDETLRVIYPADVILLRDANQGGRRWGSFNTTLRVRDDGTFNGWSGDRNGGRRGRQVRITSRERDADDALDAYADLDVRVPAGKRIELNLGVGSVTVSNVDGQIDVDVASANVSADRTRGALSIETGSGNVDVREAAGAVDLETGSGNISASSVRAQRLDLETGSGNIRISTVEATQLDVETGSGDIAASDAKGDQVAFETGSGNIEVTLLAPFRSLDIETGSGNVTLRVPPTIGAEVDLETGSGDIDLGGMTIQVRRIERQHVTGTIGSGGGRLSIETGSGNVRLVRL